MGKLKELRSALENLGERFTEDFFNVILINSLPPEYGNFLDQWEMAHPSMKTTEFLLSILQQKEQSFAQNNMLAMVTKNRDWNSMTPEEKKRVSKCKRCGLKGHWAKVHQ